MRKAGRCVVTGRGSTISAERRARGGWLSRAFTRTLAALATGLPGWALAATLAGTVTHVTDGDSLWVRPAHGGAPLELRLRHVDAPERCQAHGTEAREALAQRVLRQPVRVQTHGVDDYGRTLATVTHRGQDIGAWLVQQGHAWSDDRARGRGPYAAQQQRARQARRGLWQAPQPMRPRQFRQAHGRCP